MKKLRHGLIVLGMLLTLATSATAGVSIGIGLPNVSIGINLPLFPELTLVPGYPVYYAPQVDGNYFFYDGVYWVYQDDNWYSSSWYNGPWLFVQPDYVPLFILRVPVSYYRQPPIYFSSWQSNAPPRWGQHWGRDWEHRRGGWDRWKRSSVPAPAPLPVYQRQYSGDRYPHVEQQHKLRTQQYRYQPREKIVREHLKAQKEHKATAPTQRGKHEAPPVRNEEPQRSAPIQQKVPGAPHAQPQQRGGNHENAAPAQPAPGRRAPAVHEQKQQRQQGHDRKQQPEAQHEQQTPDQQKERGNGRDHRQDQQKDEEHGHDRQK